ncbi:hypothetical protein TcasGA2_TC014302 [Tribolium castaneum]|uniref:Uncharacterized protein n=1 Tax=Tribolium castaneum TaxID=7070 RepID=D6WL65_TRICA|nr:hypothetical protein TcasGA2_TC014302 [Tribolium castaneum]
MPLMIAKRKRCSFANDFISNGFIYNRSCWSLYNGRHIRSPAGFRPEKPAIGYYDRILTISGREPGSPESLAIILTSLGVLELSLIQSYDLAQVCHTGPTAFRWMFYLDNFNGQCGLKRICHRQIRIIEGRTKNRDGPLNLSGLFSEECLRGYAAISITKYSVYTDAVKNTKHNTRATSQSGATMRQHQTIPTTTPNHLRLLSYEYISTA